ncbi:MAG: hypothetical protein JWN63_1639 [Candidatus Acidoferrum typicum]|nr:hypothetical protein [Candidatus Acidoferrum typicum]
MECRVAKNTKCGGSGEHTQRSIFRYRVIEMQAQRQHLTKCTLGSMGVDHAIFNRPRSPARAFTPLLQRQSRVLMPHYQPVSRWRFVEERRAERKCLSTKILLRDSQQSCILSHRRDGWQSHRMAHASPAAWQICSAQLFEQPVNISWLQDSRNYRKTLFLNRLQPTQGFLRARTSNIFFATSFLVGDKHSSLYSPGLN